MTNVTVIARANVLGLAWGDQADVEPTPYVEQLIGWGHLELVTELGPGVGMEVPEIADNDGIDPAAGKPDPDAPPPADEKPKPRTRKGVTAVGPAPDA